jgi:hypothetical protein
VCVCVGGGGGGETYFIDRIVSVDLYFFKSWVLKFGLIFMTYIVICVSIFCI